MSREGTVKKIQEETFRDTTERGVKQGVVKNTVDKSLSKVTDPVAEQLQNLMRKLHPEAGLADDAVKSFVHFIALNGAAEIAQHSSAVTTKIPGLKGFTEDKTDAFARWLRGYSGEQGGTKVSNTAFAMAPVLASMMSNPDLKSVLDGVTPQLPEGDKSNNVDLETGIAELSEDDDDEGDNG